MLENLNRHTHIKEMKSILQNLSTKRTPGTDDLIGEFHKLFKKDMKTILHKLFLEKRFPVFWGQNKLNTKTIHGTLIKRKIKLTLHGTKKKKSKNIS